MNMIFDTHAHYDDNAFDVDRQNLLQSLPDKDLFAVVNAGADVSSSLKSVEISKKYSYIYASVGVHPENITENILQNPHSSYITTLEELIENNKKVVAVGEIGLDYHYNSQNKDAQKDVFERQTELALKHGLPVMVHDREAHGDTLNILKKYKPKGIVHCFSGSLEMALEIIKIGMFLGVGGVVTFKNAKNIVDVVENIPLSNIVLETDAPYMAPVPFRGKRCDSSYIKYTAEKIAELKNVDVSEVLEITKNNALGLFNIE